MKYEFEALDGFVKAVFRWVRILRISGTSFLMVAGCVSVAIFGTEAWRWDLFTVCLAILAGVGLFSVFLSELFHRLIKKHVDIDPPLF
ncbi:hypothetical protein D1820_11920 [Phaeobacter sp. LSS9]|nr:hypothetical protein D1820_11920 [Phaeobacter sp. LSS9]